MGSESGGGSTYDDAPMQYAQQKKKRELEERRVQMAEMEDQKGYYARSKSGNIIRSSSGSAVTSTAGRQAVENVRAFAEGRAAMDMSGEQPVERTEEVTTEEKPQETSKPKTVSKPSVASRRALLGATKGAKQRLFY
jgi:hypothetical protein